MPGTDTKSISPIVYLVDDDDSVLKVLTLVLGAEGFATRAFVSPRRFLTEHDHKVPGCLILDLDMPGMSGLEVQRFIATREPPRPVIFISGKSDIPSSVAAMKNGAIDFLVKPFSNEILLQSVREAIKKDETARKQWGQALELKQRFLQLTEREREVFRQVLSGKLNKQIAPDLGITEKTTKTHRARVFRKMGAESLAELVHFAELLKTINVSLDG